MKIHEKKCKLCDVSQVGRVFERKEKALAFKREKRLRLTKCKQIMRQKEDSKAQETTQ